MAYKDAKKKYEVRKRWRLAHPNYNKEWRKLHPERTSLYESRRNFGGLKSAVLERDNHSCQVCGITSEENYKKSKKGLCVHHKDKNRANNSMDNLTTLCNRCHSRLHNGGLCNEIHCKKIVKMKETHTFQEIGDKYGFSRQRAHQIYKQCVCY